MKNLKLKVVIHLSLVVMMMLTTVVVGRNIYQTMKQVCESQPKGSGISCFYEMFE